MRRGIGVDDSAADREIRWYMNGKFRLAILRDLNTGEEKVVDFTDYTKRCAEPADADYRKGVVHRNWSILGDINQKRTRPQDAPVAVEELTARQKRLIAEFERRTGRPIL